MATSLGFSVAPFASQQAKRRHTDTSPAARPAPLAPFSDLDLEVLKSFITPPPTPFSEGQSPRLPLRLRSNSGLSLHTNQAAFRQYTDYERDGSLRSPALPVNLRSYPAFLQQNRPPTSSSLAEVAEDRDEGGQEPHMDFFHKDVVRKVLHSPAMAQRLCKFAQSRYHDSSMDFLIKLDEYNRALINMTSLVGHISTSFVSPTAMSPLSLTPEVSATLNSNLRSFNKQLLPFLEGLFESAREVVEKQITQDIYPDFVKHQLMQGLKCSLSVNGSLCHKYSRRYPGLGTSFVLTDSTRADGPILYASDDYYNMMRLSRATASEDACSLLLGVATGNKAGQQMREALANGEQTTQLLLTYRADGTSFWNLVFVCQLQDQGQAPYCLAGQVNVSDNLGSHCQDIMRLLDFETPLEDWADMSTHSHLGSSTLAPLPENPTKRPQRSRFFKSFRKSAPQYGRRASVQTGESGRDTPLTPPAEPDYGALHDDMACLYPRFLVMKYDRPVSSFLGRRASIAPPRLPVHYCSAAALQVFGLDPSDSDMVLGQDIFSLLADHGTSPSINKTASAAIWDKISAGESASFDLLLGTESSKAASKQARMSSILSLSSRGKDIRDLMASGSEPEGEAPRRKSDSYESVDGFGPRTLKVVSHWAPLKDAEGDVRWVVAVLAPAST